MARLREDTLHGMVLLHTGEALVEALELEAEAAVVDAGKLESNGFQIVDVRLPLVRF